jgi:DNA-damage-inducible protein D
MQLGDENQAITLFEQQPVRRAWHDGRWFYSVIDTIAVLTESQRPRKYWSDLKAKLIEQGYFELSAKIGQLKLRAPDGKMYLTDCADTETLLRIIQSIPSPKAEPFKRWLAGLGAEVIDDRTEDQRRLDYRVPKAEAHKGLHAEIHTRGICSRRDHAEFDVRGHQELYNGETPRETEEKRDIPPGEGPSWMGSEEMGDTIFRDVQSRAYIKRMDITGKVPVTQAHEKVSREVRDTIIRLGNTPPEQLPKATKSIEQAASDEKRRHTKGMDLFPEIDTIQVVLPDDEGDQRS